MSNKLISGQMSLPGGQMVKIKYLSSIFDLSFWCNIVKKKIYSEWVWFQYILSTYIGLIHAK